MDLCYVHFMSSNLQEKLNNTQAFSTFQELLDGDINNITGEERKRVIENAVSKYLDKNTPIFDMLVKEYEITADSGGFEQLAKLSKEQFDEIITYSFNIMKILKNGKTKSINK